MDGYLGEAPALSTPDSTRSCEWMHRVIALVEVALGQIHSHLHPAQGSLLEAASLLRQQIEPPATRGSFLSKRRLAGLARRARCVPILKIISSGPVLSSRTFAYWFNAAKRTSRAHSSKRSESHRTLFSYDAVWRLAAQYMLTTDVAPSDIAPRCGFTDQAHLSKHFRQSAGHTPAAWRRARRNEDAQPGFSVLRD